MRLTPEAEIRLAAIRTDLAQYLDEGVLQHVYGRSLGREHAVRQREHHAAEHLVELGVRTTVAALCARASKAASTWGSGLGIDT